ncbi:Dpy30 domain containing 2 [Plakobranchus ocellatus]|uniref:Dpy30 domain containing 2 n=1 Tax=Plakobranchus ocellatus TaxID=259542 RepID=A0AAV4BD51_9GAST|nr:Dpy30 domain containing 2 [Plakobranchus ocellatus]
MELLEPESTTDVPYLRENIGKIITSCLVDVVHGRPDDPIDFIAKWLYHYADTRLYYQSKRKLAQAVNDLEKEHREDIQDRWIRIELMKESINKYRLTRMDLHVYLQKEVEDYIPENPQEGDIRLLGLPSGRGADSGAPIRDRRAHADLRADSQTTVPQTSL